MGDVSSAVVVGASGGIGRALCDALVAGGRYAVVYGTSRKGEPITGAHSCAVDLTDEGGIAQAADAIGRNGPVGLVIVASGILHETNVAPEKSVKALAAASLARLFAVNATGPALVAKHFLPLMPRQGRAVFAALSARVGSIDDNRLGGWYGYRASKAALNQIVRTLAVETARTRPETVILALHPGTVATTLSRPFRTSDGAGVVRPDIAAQRLLAVIDRAMPAQSGRLLSYDGSTIKP